MLEGRSGCLVLAVSGGPDSVALLRLAVLAAPDSPWLVVTVDHDLRAGSRDEAEAVAHWAASLGMPHRILTWADGRGTVTRVQERARHARYDLLFGLAREIGAGAVVTAHTMDDQAETVLMRLVSGSGISGLAGMRQASREAGVELLRPFLGVAKARLLATCRERGWPYHDDPSNRDLRFGRVRARRILAELAPEGLTAARLAQLATRAARQEAALDRYAALALQAALRRDEPGRIELDLGRLRDEPEEIGLRVLRAAICRVVGPDAPLRLRRLERLAAGLRDAAGRDGSAFGATLAGALLRVGPGDRLIVTPEPPRRRGGS